MSVIQRVSPVILTKYVQAIFVAAGLPAGDARQVAEIMVLQEMRGVRTHGLRFIESFLTSLANNHMNPRPGRRVLRSAGASVVIDGDRGLGVIACMETMNRAIRKARVHGIGIGITINNNHFLSAAPYCLRAAEAGMVGLAFSNTWAGMGYPGAVGRIIGNGPIGFAAPTASGYTMVFDAALSTSYGNLLQWSRDGRGVPAGFMALDAKGKPTTDPRKVLDGGTPVPIGGHKGAGLVLMIEVLTGVLGGGAFLSAILPPAERASKRDGESQCCVAVDIAHFMPVKTFRARMTEFIADLKSKPLAEGYDAIVVPGEKARRNILETSRRGILVDPDLVTTLTRLAGSLGVKSPFKPGK